MVILIFLAIFTGGIFSFTPDINQWIYENWGAIRPNVEGFSYEQFASSLTKDILSLGVFTATITLGIIICMFSIIQLLGWKKVIRSILPPISLLVIVFSSALVMIAIFSGRTASFLNLPTWMNQIAMAVGLLIVLAGFLGYYASVKQIKKLLVIYLFVLCIVCLLMVVAAIGYLKISGSLEEIIDKDWPVIYEGLLTKGYNVTKTIFMEYVLINFKFAGLYGIMYSFFVILAIACTISKLKMLSAYMF